MKFGRREFGIGVLGGALLGRGETDAMSRQSAQPAQEIGVPVTSANRIAVGTARGFLPNGHDLLCWTTTAESGGHFSAMDLQTGKVTTHPLNHLEAWPLVFGSDGNVYTGSTSGEVMRWNPRTDAWGALGKPLFKFPGASLNHVRVLCEGRDKWLYAGSVYGERARLHIETGEIEKLPSTPEQGNWYVSSVVLLPDGRIAFGYGHKARIFVYDPAEKRDVGQWMPEGWKEDGFVFTIAPAKTVVYASHFPSGRRAAFDLKTGAFLSQVPWKPATTANPWSIWSSGAGNDFFVLPGTDTVVTSDGKEVYQFDPRHPDLPPTVPLSRFKVPAEMELTLRYSVTSNCRVQEYDRLRRKVLRMTQPSQPKVARNIFSLGVGPDGCVYGGAYQSTELFRYNPATREMTNLGDHHPGWSGETFSYAIWKDEILTASYTNGAVVAYNPKKPWKAEVGKMVNPRRVGFLGQQVYRPVSCCVSEDGRLWAVGPAGWGSTGFGIAWIDPKTGKTESQPLADSPQDILPLPGNRLLTVSSGLLRWIDSAAGKEIAQCASPAPLVSATPLVSDGHEAEGPQAKEFIPSSHGPSQQRPGPSARLLLASASELFIVSAETPGKIEILRRFACPAPCTRALVWRGKAVIGGSQGFATIDLTTGATTPFCSTPLGHRWAFAVASDTVFFYNGAKLLMAALPSERS